MFMKQTVNIDQNGIYQARDPIHSSSFIMIVFKLTAHFIKIKLSWTLMAAYIIFELELF